MKILGQGLSVLMYMLKENSGLNQMLCLWIFCLLVLLMLLFSILVCSQLLVYCKRILSLWWPLSHELLKFLFGSPLHLIYKLIWYWCHLCLLNSNISDLLVLCFWTFFTALWHYICKLHWCQLYLLNLDLSCL